MDVRVNKFLPTGVGKRGVVMKQLLLASVALVAVGMTAPAKAADMPVKYVAPAPVFTWTGCYVGVHIGYKWGTSKQTYGGTRAGVPDAFLPVGFDVTGDYNVNGPVGGGQGGCNYQTGTWVWGVEVDGAWSSASGQANPTQGAIDAGANPELVFTTNERWLATARGRLGWAADRWMWYVTGGAVLDRRRRQQRRASRSRPTPIAFRPASTATAGSSASAPSTRCSAAGR